VAKTDKVSTPVPVAVPALRESKLYRVLETQVMKDHGDVAFGVPSRYTVSRVIRKSDGQLPEEELIRIDRWRATKSTAKTGNLGFCHGGPSFVPSEVRELMFILKTAGFDGLPNS